MDGIIIRQFGDRKICIAGIGKLFYQDGYPISIAISELSKKGIEVSILHVADECLKNGWSKKTTLNKLKSDFEDDIDRNVHDIALLEMFINTTYDSQREMIFQYLFSSSSKEIIGDNNKRQQITQLFFTGTQN